MILTPDQIAAIDAANGRRRERTLSVDDVEGTARTVLACASWLRRRPALRALAPLVCAVEYGGFVANAYKYRSYTTRARVRPDGARRVQLDVDVAGASRPHGRGRDLAFGLAAVETPEERAALAALRALGFEGRTDHGLWTFVQRAREAAARARRVRAARRRERQLRRAAG